MPSIPRLLTCTAFAVALALPSVSPQAQLSQAATEPASQVDALFTRWHTPDSPGAAVLVMKDGDIVHARGYGMANLEHGVPIRPSTVFDIASVSKQFGAMAVALLEGDGRLSLDDDVRKYVPELPDFGMRITIRHLIHHTSGIRDWPGTLAIGGWDFQDVISFEQILRMAYHQRELNFAPGEAYAYSNTGYNLLAEVVSRVSGRSFRAFAAERIFEPLGMRSTHFQDDSTEIVPDRAESYRPAPGGGFRRVTSNLTALGSSSLFTTIEDLSKWIANFEAAAPVVGGPEVVRRLHERGVLNSGETIAYAFGQSIGEYRGLPTVSHTGSWAGYRSVLVRFPEQRFAVGILANTADMNPASLANDIADVYLADRLGPAPTPGENGRRGGGPAPSWQPTSAELEAYAGTYRSAELDTAYVLTVRDGQLIASHFRTGERRLRPVEADRFQAPGFGEVRFLRRADGSVEGFTATSDRVRGLRFVRER